MSPKERGGEKHCQTKMAYVDYGRFFTEKTALVRETALEQSRMRSLRSLHGVPAGRLAGFGAFVLPVAPVDTRLKNACSSLGHSFLPGLECVQMSVFIIVSLRACKL